jgi:cytochrome c-type biogenesis protein CcmH/NrfG
MKSLITLAFATLLACSFGAHAQPGGSGALTRLQTRWAEVNYQLKEKQQIAAYEELLGEAETFVQQEPNNADLLIWSGIIKSSYAGAKGGLGALKYAKASKADLEKALALNPSALDGSAYTSLGTLYFKVPGWPVGFGDEDKAEELLQQVLQINASGIDPNYFYGEFLREQHRYAEAIRYYERALQAPARPGRELADNGRRREIEAALADARKHLE